MRKEEYVHLLNLQEKPLNYGHLERANCSCEDTNEVCGDLIHIDMQVDDQQRIAAIKWSGNGCMLSRAAASLLTEEVKGMTLEQIQDFSELRLLSLLDVTLNMNKLACALLPLKVLQEGVTNFTAEQERQLTLLVAYQLANA